MIPKYQIAGSLIGRSYYEFCVLCDTRAMRSILISLVLVFSMACGKKVDEKKEVDDLEKKLDEAAKKLEGDLKKGMVEADKAMKECSRVSVSSLDWKKARNRPQPPTMIPAARIALSLMGRPDPIRPEGKTYLSWPVTDFNSRRIAMA